MSSSIIDHVALCKAIDIKHLKLVKCKPQSVAVTKWASLFFKKGECFSNALNLTEIDNCDYVLGYVYLSDLGVVLEHAWNCDNEGHFDLTGQLFWNGNTPTHYVELKRFNADTAQQLFEQLKGVDHTALHRSREYKYLFGL